MLDPRLYRAALVPVLLAVLVAAFSLGNRPAPIVTTLAPDAFDGTKAMQVLEEFATAFPERRPGGSADEQLAQRIATALRARGPYQVRIDRFQGQTIDGERSLVNVVATRTGAPLPGIVVVAHRDAAARGARAELSGTAALLELARVAGDGRLQRNITFVSTTGGSGGLAGARRLAQQLGARADAVIVLGDLAGRRPRRPFVVGWSNGRGQVPLRLRRTLEAAVRSEAGTDGGAPRTATQWARLALPVTVGEQGPFGRAGQPAVLLSVSGERPPAADVAVSPRRLQLFGRAALRAIYALDEGPDLAESPRADLVTRSKVVPGWAIRLLVGALLLAPLLAAVDGFARARRRGVAVEPWLRWTVATALPFLFGCIFARILAAAGLLAPAPPSPIAASVLRVDGSATAAIVAVVLAFVLGWIFLRPLALGRLGVRAHPSEPGAGIAVLLVACLVAAALWVLNPYAAALVVPAVHLWVFALAPRGRLPRVAAVGLVLASLLPALALVLADARAFGLDPAESSWFGLLLVAGGHVPTWSWLLWSTMAGTTVAAVLVAVYRPRSSADDDGRGVRSRGPLSYAGPGSLGGTESALRR
jgi:hypothetical protein